MDWGFEWYFDLLHYHCCLTVRLIECNDGSALDSWLPTAWIVCLVDGDGSIVVLYLICWLLSVKIRISPFPF
jgi:hypothetical protein